MPYKDPEVRKAKHEEWRKKNQEKINARSRQKRQRAKQAVYALYGNMCAACGISDFRVLQVDHILGNGAEERKSMQRNILSFYRRILTDPDKYQLLCANCNWIKRYEEEEAPYYSIDVNKNVGAI